MSGNGLGVIPRRGSTGESAEAPAMGAEVWPLEAMGMSVGLVWAWLAEIFDPDKEEFTNADIFIELDGTTALDCASGLCE